MKTPIEPSEIRKGDLIREEYTAPAVDRVPHTAAVEYRAQGDCQTLDVDHATGHYLLDRPAPPVVLPTEPTLGKLTWYAGQESSGLGIHRSRIGVFEPTPSGVTDGFALGEFRLSDIIAWDPMTAVPTEALDELRAHAANAPEPTYGRIATFLTAIDNAATT